MTQEEKARELAIKCSKTIDDYGNEVYNAFCEAALREMAEWKERQIIKWLVDNIDKYIIYNGYDEITEIKPSLIRDLKKAMKGGEK